MVTLDWTCSTEEQITTVKLFSDGFQREKLTQDIPSPHDERTETKNSDRTGKKNSNSNCKNRTERREAQLRANLVTCKGPRIESTDRFCYPVHS